MANTQNLDLVKPLGTDHALVSVLNSNSDKIDAYAGAVNASLDGLRDGLGILADGNTHAAITSGQFVYVKNHQTLPQGLYQATTNIAANGTLSTSNLAADPKGGLNTLSEQIATLSPVHQILNSTLDFAKSGKVVTVNGYRTGLSLSDTPTKICDIPNGIPKPPRDIRSVCNVGSNAYSAQEQGYLIINTAGELLVSTKSGTASTFYVSLSYIAE